MNHRSRYSNNNSPRPRDLDTDPTHSPDTSRRGSIGPAYWGPRPTQEVDRNGQMRTGPSYPPGQFDATTRATQRGMERNHIPAGKYHGIGPKNYRRSDERIHEDVCETLTADPHVDPSEIEVSVKDGIVTLSGMIFDRQMKRAAEDCISHLRGVHDVQNDLKLQKINKAHLDLPDAIDNRNLM